MKLCAWRNQAPGGFTLIELLVVIVVVVLLAALAGMAVQSALDAGRGAACSTNLRQIGVGIGTYASDHDGRIPFGPKAGVIMSAGTLYPATGSPTSLISLGSGKPVALGLVLSYLRDPKVLSARAPIRRSTRRRNWPRSVIDRRSAATSTGTAVIPRYATPRPRATILPTFASVISARTARANRFARWWSIPFF